MFQKLFRRSTPPPLPPPVVEEEDGTAIDKQVKRLAKEVYKSNTLTESQLEQTRQAVELMRAALGELQNTQKSNQEALQGVRVDAIKALFPVVDSVEAGLVSGAALLDNLIGVSAEQTTAIRGWLDGQRLLLERLDNILQNEGIQRIPTTGQPFDPQYHVAVKAGYDPQQPSGIILKEERRGYRRGNSVLRYADVIVTLHNE